MSQDNDEYAELRDKLSELACAWINGDLCSDEPDQGLHYFHEDVLKCLEDHGVDGEEAEDILDTVGVRMLDFGDSRPSSVFPTGTPGADVYKMISEWPGFDFNYEETKRYYASDCGYDDVPDFLEELQDNPSQLENDIWLDNPLGGSIVVGTVSATEMLKMCGVHWPDLGGNNPSPGE